MRKDMFKVIVERPRRNPKRYKKGRDKNWEDLPKKESMRKKYDWNWNRKELNENLKPLVRFLKSKVGSKWDDVFSEICENLTLDSAIQKHVRDHVFDYVKVNVLIESKKVYHIPKYYGKWTELWNDDLYIDPNNGILKLYKTKRRLREKRNELSDKLQGISSSKSKTIIEGGKVYKLFKDKLTKDFTIKTEANKIHAKSDFESCRGMFSDSVKNLKAHIEFILNKTKVKSIYFDTYLQLINSVKDKRKTERYYKVGDKVKFRRYASEDFLEGVINYIDYTEDNSQFMASITVGTKNIRVHSSFTQFQKI